MRACFAACVALIRLLLTAHFVLQPSAGQRRNASARSSQTEFRYAISNWCKLFVINPADAKQQRCVDRSCLQVIVEKAPRSDIPEIDKKKCVLPLTYSSILSKFGLFQRLARAGT